MNRKVSLMENVFVGSMLFGLFFGAGNLIFPVHMGQLAGGNVLLASLGFVVTATGLPYLGVLTIGITNSSGLLDLAGRVGKRWGILFTCLLYLTIGPFFAYPRTGTVSYEIGMSMFIGPENQRLGLLIFTLLFFGIALIFSLYPGRILLWVGKVLNPLFLVLLTILIIYTFVRPMGDASMMPAATSYQNKAFLSGFLEGYNTMDALASLAFGVIVVDSIKKLGVTEPKEITKSMAKAGFVSMILMVIIYSCLSYMGATSLGTFEVSDNGGIALAQIAGHYFGPFGNILLALIVTIACLKTAIGLVTSCSEAFVMMFPRSLSYRKYVVLFTVIGCGVANVGLTKIISLSLPILMFLYPLAIVLMIVSFLEHFFGGGQLPYITSALAAGLFGFGDALAVLPESVKSLKVVAGLLELYEKVPFFSVGMGWVLPSLLGIALGYGISYKKRQKNIAKKS